jgi:hypothetical protein
VRPVHKEQGDGTGNLVVGAGTEGADVAHSISDTSGGKVGEERLVIALGLRLEAADLLRSTVVPCVRVDRNDADALGRSTCEHDRAAAAKAADLHDLLTGMGGGRSGVERGHLVVGQPSLHSTDSRPELVEGSPAHPK